MIRFYQKENDRIEEVERNAADWIQVSSPLDHNELEHLADTENFPVDFLIDSLDIDERSRYDREDGVKLIVLNTPFLNQDEKESDAIYITAPIGIIIKDDIIITISSVENPILSKFLKNRVKNFNPSDIKLFVLQLFEQTVYEYLDCLKRLNIKRNLIEKELYNSSRNKELQQLLRIEKSLVYMVNSLSDNDLLKQKIRRTDFLGIRDLEMHQDLFEDIIIDNSQALEMANVHTNILSGTMEAYASIISNNLNLVIHKLTIITISLMVPTLVASFYGMNLPNLPLEEHPYAFYIILLISGVLGVVLISVFRKSNRI
ncbi:MAG: magnesium transporter CorA family protein [Candidatus Kariarchaeaceae archaeon]|jgi:magnesium transporter